MAVAGEGCDGAGAVWFSFFFRGRTLLVAAFSVLWGIYCFIILGANVPEHSAYVENGHLLTCFSFLTIGAALLILTVDGGAGADAGRVFFRGRILSAGAFLILWGTSSIILISAFPDLSTDAGHLFLCFTLLTVGVVLLNLTVAAPLAAARLEGWLIAAMP